MFLAISEVTKVDRQSIHDFTSLSIIARKILSVAATEVLSAELCQKVQTLIIGDNNRLIVYPA